MLTVTWIFNSKFCPYAGEQIQGRFKNEGSGYILAFINCLLQFDSGKLKESELI